MADVNQDRRDLAPGGPQVRPRGSRQPEFGQRGAMRKSVRWPPQEFPARQVRFGRIGVERERPRDGRERAFFALPVVRRETERLLGVRARQICLQRSEIRRDGNRLFI